MIVTTLEAESSPSVQQGGFFLLGLDSSFEFLNRRDSDSPLIDFQLFSAMQGKRGEKKTKKPCKHELCVSYSTEEVGNKVELVCWRREEVFCLLFLIF